MFQKGVDTWAQKELALTKRKIELQGSLETVEVEAGVALLDAEESGSSGASASFDKLDRTRGEVRMLAAAITACRARRLETIKTNRASEVAALRKQAADKSAELRSLESKISKALAQLAELDGCDYVPSGTPRTGALRAQIPHLARVAEDLDQANVPVSGVVDVDGVTTADEVLLTVAAYPAGGPTVEQVLAWLNACEDAARKYRASSFADHPRRVHFVWDVDGIDVRQSVIFCAALAKKQDDGKSIYPETGTFRSGVAPSAVLRDARSPIEAPARGGFYRG